MVESEDGLIAPSGRRVSRQQLEEIQETVGLFPSLSRKELAATISEHLGWFTVTGSNKVDACIKLLEKLERQGLILLPKKQGERGRGMGQKPIASTNRTDPGTDLAGSMADLGQIELEVVADKESTGLWNEYVNRYHYLGYKQPFGYSLRYFIESQRCLLGCMMFAGASKALGARDRWIGWSQEHRLSNLPWVVNNSRFLIFPWVRIQNLASYVLGQAARRLRADWQQRWGYSPVLIETFVDPARYCGSSYKAANWQYLGMTSGEGLVRKGKRYHTSPKMIFAMPLVKGFRSLLCSQRLEGGMVK